MTHSISIASLNLVDIGPFRQLELRFPTGAGVCLICGDNGIGKTTILEAIAAAFTFGPSQERLKRRAGTDFGKLAMRIKVDGEEQSASAVVKGFMPDDNPWFDVFHGLSENVINIRTNRDFKYTKSSSISGDPVLVHNEVGRRLAAGLNGGEIKQWFANRYLMFPHADQGSWTDAMKKNLVAAKAIFSVLDPEVSLAFVDVRTFEIMVATPFGEIPFEYLSSGFRTAYVLLLGILKEIEFRGLGVSAAEFSGIILIDEIELHLHPSWQRKIVRLLTSFFPQAQFIATTHSPHVVQVAKAAEVIAIARSTDGTVFRRSLSSSKYGFAGWTVDEVLEDVMGVEDTKSEQYRSAFRNLDSALSDEDTLRIKKAAAELYDLLHPTSPLRKLIRLQIAPFVGSEE